MNHIVTMSIDVDEETIRKKIADNCASEIIRKLNDDYLRRGYHYGDKEGLAEVVHSVTEDIIAKNKDFIIDEAIKKIVKKVTDSKAFKDKFGEIER